MSLWTDLEATWGAVGLTWEEIFVENEDLWSGLAPTWAEVGETWATILADTLASSTVDLAAGNDQVVVSVGRGVSVTDESSAIDSTAEDLVEVVAVDHSATVIGEAAVVDSASAAGSTPPSVATPLSILLAERYRRGRTY